MSSILLSFFWKSLAPTNIFPFIIHGTVLQLMGFFVQVLQFEFLDCIWSLGGFDTF